MSLLAPTLQAFFTDRLITQRDASPSTIAAYRDTFRLLLAFAEQQTGKQPYQLDLADLDAPLIGAFLTHLEHDRGNTPRTRNARLAAIHSLYRYAALRHPEHVATIARVMAIPTKRHERNDLTYLTKPEIEALLHAPDRTTWLGRRDHALLLTMIKTGLRVSELIALRISDVTLAPGAHTSKSTAKAARRRDHTAHRPRPSPSSAPGSRNAHGSPRDPLFPTRQGRPLSRRRRRAAARPNTPRAAAASCPSLASKRVTPHALRHYVDGWVMWPAGVFPLLGLSLSPVPAT